MKSKYLRITSAVVLGLFLAGSALQAAPAGTAEPATGITKDEAAKKYPTPKGYPRGERDIHAPSGWITSPYPPRTLYDCSKIGHGELVLDTHVNKVFVRP
jgi:hypothetical protein